MVIKNQKMSTRVISAYGNCSADRGEYFEGTEHEDDFAPEKAREQDWAAGRMSMVSCRDIPLAPIVVNTLAQWRSVCPPGKLGLVFPNTNGEVESYFTIRSSCWVPLQIDSGIIGGEGKAKYSFHALRHAAASLFIAHLGWTPKRLQAVMGHASIAMTFDRYGHLFAESRQ
jgi:integrase